MQLIEMNYVKIYSAANTAEAYLIQGLLKQNAIDSSLLGENLAIAIGGLPPDVCQIDILVDQDKYAKAQSIILKYENLLKKPSQNAEDWECIHCEKVNPSSFEVCWSCQNNNFSFV